MYIEQNYASTNT